MKKYLFALIIQVVISISFISAQSKHMMFRNVPINGNLTSFIHKMEKQGFTLDEQEDNQALMLGTFINLPCSIIISSTPRTNKVFRVIVIFSKKTNWFTLESDYFKYKEQFESKYGKPNDSVELFTSPYHKGDGDELQAVKSEKCVYYSLFDAPNGITMVSIGIPNPYIIFTYVDNINNRINDKETNANIQDEI